MKFSSRGLVRLAFAFYIRTEAWLSDDGSIPHSKHIEGRAVDLTRPATDVGSLCRTREPNQRTNQWFGSWREYWILPTIVCGITSSGCLWAES